MTPHRGADLPSVARAVRGLDLFDTPPIALGPLFAHEPLLAGVTAVCEPFCGLGNLVVAMRARGLTVHASDILDRGCPDSTVLDFPAMTERPAGCDVLLSNCPYAGRHEPHRTRAGARLSRDRAVAQAAVPVHCRALRAHAQARPPAARSRPGRAAAGMHDAAHLASGGKKASQNQTHAWFVFDRHYCGPATINPVSIHRPDARMPWADHPSPRSDNGYHPPPRGTSRAYVLARLRRDGREDLAGLVEARALSARGALRRLQAGDGQLASR